MDTDAFPPTEVDAVPPTEVDPPQPVPAGRLRHLAAGALVGGLCGALVATGAFVVFDDDDADGRDTAVAADTPVVREASTIGEAGDVAGIIAKVQPAVVSVTTGGGQGGQDGAGTGFVVSADGFIVTNNHVVAAGGSIEVAFTEGRTYDAEIVGRDAPADLAVLRIDETGLPVVELGDSEALQVGDEVVAIGNALALEGGFTDTRGIISGPPRQIGTEIGTVLESVLQTDAAINRGNSGGPLVDAGGRVIGINTAIADPAFAQNVGFAIPISHARPIIEDLKAGREPAFLGVTTDSVTPELADDLDLPVDAGALVRDVTPGSPAADAGIEEDDVIVEIGGTEVADSSDVGSAIREHRPGEEVEVVVARGQDRLTVKATLAERPESG